MDAWLAGLVHRSVEADPIERLRHERFIVGRTASAVTALAGLPPYLVARSAPTGLDCLALLALAAPLAGVFTLARYGRMPLAQGIVSVSLMLFVAAAAAGFGGAGSLAALALLAIPLDALVSGSRRACLIAAALAVVGVPVMIGFGAVMLPPGQGSALGAIFTVAVALGFGHFLAQAVGERRVASFLRSGKGPGAVARDGATLQAIDDLVTWHDRNGQVLSANAAGARLIGAPPASLHGRGLFARIHVADRPAFLKAISDAATSTDAVVVQLRLRTGEALAGDLDPAPARIAQRQALALVWVEMRAHRLVDDQGCAVVAVTRSIAEHKQLADDLDALRREAVVAGESRAQLLATVSHELRTPLNAVIGYAEMLMGQSGPGLGPNRDDRRFDYAQIIHHSGHHMLGVVNTLLDLSTIEAGHYALQPEPVEVADLVQECCRFMSLTAERSGIVLAQDLAPELPMLTADRRACQQVLLNLLSNALKFTPRDGVVTVQVRRDGDRIALTVRDTGIGVCETELPRLGAPFYKASSAASRSEKGSGLGLSVVRGLVGLHHGRISIASARGDGTSVTVSLPISPAHAGRPSGPAQVHTIVRSPEGPGAMKTGRTGLA